MEKLYCEHCKRRCVHNTNPFFKYYIKQNREGKGNDNVPDVPKVKMKNIEYTYKSKPDLVT